MKQIIVLFALILSYIGSIHAASIDTLLVSSKMGKDIEVLVVKPESAKDIRCATIYLLHGYNGDETYWSNIADLKSLSDLYRLYIVCPNGNNSWYWDIPTNSSLQYETFISEELPTYIDSMYNTIDSREARAITGLSMGGHGALWNAIRHPNVFGAAGSMSGGVDIRPFPERWNLKELLGSFEYNEPRWDLFTVNNQLNRLVNQPMALIIDCGVNDFFIDVNRDLHRILLDLNIDHDYIERDGSHNADYWMNSIQYQMLFFDRYFGSNY